MNVTLPAALESYVRRKVEAGVYESESDVVSDSLRLMLEQDEVWSSEVARKIDAGLEDAAAGRTFTREQVSETMGAAKAGWRAERGGT